MVGHCIRHPKLLTSDLVLWEHMHHGRAQHGQPRQSDLSCKIFNIGKKYHYQISA